MDGLAEEPPNLERVNLNLAWVGVEDVPIVFVNQILGQVDDKGEVIISFGQATPPILLGSPEDLRRQAAAIPFIQVKPVAGSLSPAPSSRNSSRSLVS